MKEETIQDYKKRMIEALSSGAMRVRDISVKTGIPVNSIATVLYTCRKNSDFIQYSTNSYPTKANAVLCLPGNDLFMEQAELIVLEENLVYAQNDMNKIKKDMELCEARMTSLTYRIENQKKKIYNMQNKSNTK